MNRDVAASPPIRAWRRCAPGLTTVAAWFVLLAAADPKALADRYVDAVEDVNRAHVAKPGDEREPAFAEQLPPAAVKSLDALLGEKPGKGLGDALVRCGEAALDLDRLEDFQKVRARLLEVDAASAEKLGIALTRSRFVARGLDGVEESGLSAVSDAFDEVLDAYEHTFGFRELSKVPGKKLRLRVHFVPEITKPPHFAPQFPWHSEIDYPVISKTDFSSPTKKGQFLLYGLAHELGHVVAMWAPTTVEDADHHAWAHYTGAAIVEDLAKRRSDAPALKACRDARWRTLTKAREELRETKAEPGLEDRDQVLALLFALHDLVGPQAIGQAINALDAGSKAQRVNRVRYYTLADFRSALLATTEGKAKSKEIEKVFPRAR